MPKDDKEHVGSGIDKPDPKGLVESLKDAAKDMLKPKLKPTSPSTASDGKAG